MSDSVIEIKNISKLYRLGEIGTGTISHDINRWWNKVRGKADPFQKLGQINDRTTKGNGDYVWALKDIDINVKRGDVLGIIGQNGAGKSTLLKILSKITSPSSGQINIDGRVASLLEVGTGFHPEMTGRENAYMNGAILGMRRAEVEKKMDAIVDFAGVERYLDTPVKRYSSGMKVRLGFAVAAHLDPEILIVDEVLAVGDAEFQKKCLGKMKDVSEAEGRTILFVSHNMAAVRRLCSRAVLMKNGTLYKDGSIDEITGIYLNESKQNDSIVFENGYVRSIAIRQINEQIFLQCSFYSEEMLQKPIIGFVISDLQGQKIFGSNPLHQRPSYEIKPGNKGEISVSISQPKLLNGVYILSLWFADAVLGVLATHENVLSFEVMNMASFDQEPNARVLGNVAAAVDWHYNY